jgi:cytochrome c-type biogenesis protein CcmF
VIGLVGTTSVVAGLVGGLLLIPAGVLAARGQRRWAVATSTAVRLVLLGAIVAFAALEIALITDDFSLRYVAENHARATPLLFTIATAWAGLEGSLVLWLLVLGGFVAVFARTVRHGDQLGYRALSVLGLVAVFFFGLVLVAANPFEVVANPPADGPGPNPLLQNHLLMAVHPPLLYLGYVGLTVPFALAMAALATGSPGGQWLPRTRRWTLVAWVTLTAGIGIGGLWSYEVLGWGGYWAWDPVENASLLPWLAATAFMHSAITQARRGVLAVWSLLLVIAAYSLTILGTFLTRSGVVASVHSFTQSAVGPALLGFFLVVVVGGLGLYAARGHTLGTPRRIDALVSREGAFLTNNLLLSVLTFVVLLGTTYPLLLEAVTGEQVSVGRPFFDRFAVPLGLVLVVAAGIGPLLPYRAASREVLRRRLQPPLLSGLTASAGAVLLGPPAPGLVVTVGATTTVVVAILTAGARRLREPGLGGLVAAVRRHAGWWGGQVAHLGLALLALGIAVSGTLAVGSELTLGLGDRVNFAGYQLRYDGVITRDLPGRSVQAAQLAVLQDGSELETLQPRLTTYSGRNQAVGMPSVRTTWSDDLYIALRTLDPDEVTIEVFRYPVMWLLWTGGALMVVGGGLAMFRPLPGRSSRSRPPRDRETEEVAGRA